MADLAEMVVRGWDHFLARTDGPMAFRFILQPTMAALMAVRAGFRDAEKGGQPLLQRIARGGLSREIANELLKDIGRVFALAIIMDFVYQLIVHDGVYLLELLFTAFLLAVAPYIVLRGPVDRLVCLWRKRDKSGSKNKSDEYKHA
jgi:hypothetical protein